MEKHGIFFYIFVIFVLVLCLRIYYESDAYNLKCIIASKDGNRYCVRDREKLELAANLLASVTEKCKQLVDYVYGKFPDQENVQRLHTNFNPKNPAIKAMPF